MGIGILYLICGVIILIARLGFGVNIYNTPITIVIALAGIAVGVWYIRKAIIKKNKKES